MVRSSGSRDAVSPVRQLIPRPVRERLLAVTRLLRLVPDRRSYREFRRLEKIAAGEGEAQPLASLRIRALSGRSVAVRPGTTDLTTLVDTFGWVYHLPPEELDRRSLRLIWDLGSNVGYTVAHLAHLCPAARIVGVELDADNAAVARMNIAPWSDRCQLIHAAVWIEDGTLSYRRVAGLEYGLRVAPLADDDSEPNATAPAISLNTLLLRDSPAQIDYVKMDIEGAESRVLRENTEWAASVRAIKVEIHSPYSVSDCSADLQRLGFQTIADSKHHACVIGTRPVAA